MPGLPQLGCARAPRFVPPSFFGVFFGAARSGGCPGAQRMPRFELPQQTLDHKLMPKAETARQAAAMAEGKSGGAGLFAKQVQKRFSRAQEKVRPGPPPPIPYFIFPLSFSQGEGKGGTEGLLLLGTAQHPWVLLGR